MSQRHHETGWHDDAARGIRLHGYGGAAIIGATGERVAALCRDMHRIIRRRSLRCRKQLPGGENGHRLRRAVQRDEAPRVRRVGGRKGRDVRRHRAAGLSAGLLNRESRGPEARTSPSDSWPRLAFPRHGGLGPSAVCVARWPRGPTMAVEPRGDAEAAITAKNPPAQTRTGGSTLVTYTNYAAGRSVIDATPAATFRPFSPSMLSGCSSISRDEPPIRALAAAPPPTEPPAGAPPEAPARPPAGT